MWHEARKQERKIRGLLVDYRKRAERRQDFYERIRADPTQFIQIHGRKCKIHLDQSIAVAGDGAAIIVPWRGQPDNLIDRFDVRAHLESIPPPPKIKDPEDVTPEERQCNYERYRILAQNDFLAISEDKFLHQLHLEEQFGANAQMELDRTTHKKKSQTGTAIGYTYDDVDNYAYSSHNYSLPNLHSLQQNETECEVDSDLDMDVSIDVSKLDSFQANELNSCGRNYGMKSNDFYSFLTKDAYEAEALRMAKEEEQEKSMLSGRKSRRERRAQREKRFAGRPISPPSYAAKEDVDVNDENVNDNESDSRSSTPENSGKITYITSFGGEDELQPHSKISINLNKTQAVKDGFKSRFTYNSTNLKKNEAHLSHSHFVPRRSSRDIRNQYSRNENDLERTSRTRHSSSSHRSPSLGRRSISRSQSKSRKHFLKRRSRSRLRSSKRSNSDGKRSTSSSTTSSSASSGCSIRNRKKKLVPTSLSTLSRTPNHSSGKSKLEKNLDMHSITHQSPEISVKRYYGRKRDSKTSSEELSMEEENVVDRVYKDEESMVKASASSGIGAGQFDNSAPESVSNFSSYSAEQQMDISSGKQNLRDRLKRKMQILLNKQYKADKKAEIEKTERQQQQQQEREDEMRELALKLRKRQRELRHRYGRASSKTPKTSDADSVDSLPENIRSAQLSKLRLKCSDEKKAERTQRQSKNHDRRRSSSSSGSQERKNTSRHRHHGYSDNYRNDRRSYERDSSYRRRSPHRSRNDGHRRRDFNRYEDDFRDGRKNEKGRHGREPRSLVDY